MTSLVQSLLVFGQVYFLSPAPNIPSIRIDSANSTSIPNIDRELADSANSTSISNLDQELAGTLRPLSVVRRNDYTYTPGIGSYKVHTTVTTWMKALKICAEEGGHLAIINSRAEANVIAKMFDAAGPHANSYSPNNAWIGTHDLISQQGDYETIFGQPLAEAGFNEWHEPKSLEGPYCGATFKDGELGWFHCARKLGFICELSNGPAYTPSSDAANGITREATSMIRESLRKASTQH